MLPVVALDAPQDAHRAATLLQVVLEGLVLVDEPDEHRFVAGAQRRNHSRLVCGSHHRLQMLVA